MKTIMDTITLVLQIGDEFETLTGRQRGISDYILEHLPQDTRFTKRYILVLRHYGKNLKKAGVWEKAVKEQWDFVRIQRFVKTVVK